MKPRPPKMPRVFSSKSWFSSRTGLQLSSALIAQAIGVAERAVERDGLARTGFERPRHADRCAPSGWHDQQPPQPRSDQNGREVKKSILPRTHAPSCRGIGRQIGRSGRAAARCCRPGPATTTSRVVGQVDVADACRRRSSTMPRGLRPELVAFAVIDGEDAHDRAHRERAGDR